MVKIEILLDEQNGQVRINAPTDKPVTCLQLLHQATELIRVQASKAEFAQGLVTSVVVPPGVQLRA